MEGRVTYHLLSENVSAVHYLETDQPNKHYESPVVYSFEHWNSSREPQ